MLIFILAVCTSRFIELNSTKIQDLVRFAIIVHVAKLTHNHIILTGLGVLEV